MNAFPHLGFNLNSEWQKGTFSAICGMFAALIAEPIKQRIGVKMKMREINNALHRELSDYEQFLRRVHIESAGQRWTKYKTWKFQAFEYYFEKNREFFYSDGRLSRLKGAFQTLQATRDRLISWSASQEWSDVIVKGINNDFEILRNTGAIDGSLLDKYNAQAERHWTRRTNVIIEGIKKTRQGG